MNLPQTYSYSMVVVGICGKCAGDVTQPNVYGSTVPPVPTCIKCGARVKRNLPTLEME